MNPLSSHTGLRIVRSSVQKSSRSYAQEDKFLIQRLDQAVMGRKHLVHWYCIPIDSTQTNSQSVHRYLVAHLNREKAEMAPMNIKYVGSLLDEVAHVCLWLTTILHAILQHLQVNRPLVRLIG